MHLLQASVLQAGTLLDATHVLCCAHSGGAAAYMCGPSLLRTCPPAAPQQAASAGGSRAEVEDTVDLAETQEEGADGQQQPSGGTHSASEGEAPEKESREEL